MPCLKCHVFICCLDAGGGGGGRSRSRSRSGRHTSTGNEFHNEAAIIKKALFLVVDIWDTLGVAIANIKDQKVWLGWVVDLKERLCVM